MSEQEKQLQIFKVGDAYGEEDFYHAWNKAPVVDPHESLEDTQEEQSAADMVEPVVIGKVALAQNIVH